ncbi:hypothetical protein L2E82_01170 [Cichorium intybus]|uniref:Uncharacterized protein n=1 Tax=Cichorium intybus TaxID=13427 RepID=A0ACB9GZK8_CICIN|nr:hypothetical protein L2E82_01170 [Cichorium intybus]
MAATSSASSAPNSFDMSCGFPPNLSLKPDELHYCVQALKFFKEKRTHQLPIIEKEFTDLKGQRLTQSELDQSCSDANLHKSKNRYDDVLPSHAHTIVLDPCNADISSGTRYINASLIQVNPSESISRFIATQGPLDDTFEDFWEMIEKCGDYLPAKNGVRLFKNNILTDTRTTTTTNSRVVLRDTAVIYKEEPPLPVLHIEYPKWPDHGVPDDTSAVRDIFRRLRHLPSSKGPIVVHCSAGVGRTGTYCVIHNTIQRILIGDMSALNLITTIRTFRSQRMRMDQYVFCYDAIIAELQDLISGSNTEESFKW